MTNVRTCVHEDSNEYTLQIEMHDEHAVTLVVPKNGDKPRVTLRTGTGEHDFRDETPNRFKAWAEVVNHTEEKRKVQEWLNIRKEAALNIDPNTAEVFWEYGQTLDPYGVFDLLPEEDCVGRNYFAHKPGSDVCVSFHDLPDDVRDRLWQLHRSKLAFHLNFSGMDDRRSRSGSP